MVLDDGVLLDAWKTGQENARHFNEIVMKIRAATVLFVGGGLAALRALTNVQVSGFGWVVGGFFAVVFALYVLDRWYYHVLLLATVTWTRAIERTLFGRFRLVGLSQHVSDVYSKASLFDDGRTVKPGRPSQARAEASRSAADRLAVYYGVLLTGLAAITVWALVLGYFGTVIWARIWGLVAGAVVATCMVAIERKAHNIDFLALPPSAPKVDGGGTEQPLEEFTG